MIQSHSAQTLGKEVFGFPPSQANQILRERRGPGTAVVRDLLCTHVNPKELACDGSSFWIGRSGGWVRVA
jgi:hypothetical protein